MVIKIILADDHQLYREHLRNKLDQEPDMTVIGEAADGQEAIEVVRRLTPDIVVMDVMMPGTNGVEATRQIASDFPDVKVLGLSLHDDKQIVDAMRAAGASAYVLKDSPFAELTRAIRTVAEGGSYFSPGLGLLGSGPPADP